MENTAKDILINAEEFKRLFGEVAARYGFERAYGGWFIESPETLIVLDLQRSNHRPYYYLNIKVYVQGLFGNRYRREKKLVKTDVGDVFTRSPTEYDEFFSLESSMELSDREGGLNRLFDEYIRPMVTSASTKSGIFELEAKGQIYLLPAVREALVKV